MVNAFEIRGAVAPSISTRMVSATIFFILLAIVGIKGLSDLDVGWDSLAYHLPFAALRSGIFGSEFELGWYLRADYDGYPPLPYLLQGYLWKLSGNINATNLLSVAIFALY